jgi:hypothetical protein
MTGPFDDAHAVGKHVARGRPQQAGDDVEKRRLAATAWADQADQPAFGNGERDGVKCADDTAAALEDL